MHIMSVRRVMPEPHAVVDKQPKQPASVPIGLIGSGSFWRDQTMKILRDHQDTLTFTGCGPGKWPFIEGEKKARLIPVLDLLPCESFGFYRMYTLSDEEYKAVVGS